MLKNSLTLDARAWAQECARRAGNAGIAFRWDTTISAPCTDGKSVRVPPLPTNATAEDFTILRGSVIHECGHLLRPACFSIAKREKLDMASPLGACLNIVEDAAQERASAMRWKGDRRSLAESHKAIAARQIRKAAEPMPKGSTVAPDAAPLMAAMGVSLLSGADWSTDMATTARKYVEAMDRIATGALATFDALVSEGWPEKIAAITDVEHSWRVARALYARLFPGKPESENKKSDTGEPEDGDGEAGESGEGDGEGEDGDGAKGKAKKGKGKGKPVGGKIPWELLTHSDHLEDGRAMPSSIDWTGKTADGAPQFYTREVVTRPAASDAGIASAAASPFPAALVGEVRRLLQAKARVRFDHERLDGRLDARNIGRVLMPQVGDGTFNRSIFRQRVPVDTLNCALTVLVDCSGSMLGEKIVAATSAAMALNDLASTALRVPSELLGFSTTDRDTPHLIEFKTFAERRVNRGLVGARMERVQHGMMRGNADGDSLLSAAQRIRGRREARRIIVVLSDGCPAEGCNGSSSYDNLKAAVAAVRGSGIEVYGIGIMDSNVRHFYSPDAPVIRSAAEVPEALITVLKDVLQRKAEPV